MDAQETIKAYDYLKEIEEEDRETIEELFSDNGWFTYHNLLTNTPCAYLISDESEDAEFDFGGNLILGFPKETHEVCRGSFDLSERELDSLIRPKRKNKEEDKMENRILPLLGLSDGASEADVYQAVKEMKERLDIAEGKLLEIEAREFIEANRGRISNDEAFMQLYMKHGKEVASAFLDVIL